MRWNDLLLLCENSVAQSIGDTTNYYFKKYPLKLYASAIQQEASKRILCLEDTQTITTVASTEEYTLATDFIQADACKYGTSWFLTEVTDKPQDAQNSTGIPSSFFIRSNKIGFYPIPNASSASITLWYKRMTSPYAIRFSNNGNSTTANIEITLTGIKITYDASNKSYAFATYTTISSIVAAINADSATTKVVATACPTILGTRLTANLELLSSVSILSSEICVFLEPELPEEMQIPILLNAMSQRLFIIDREFGEADRYKDYLDKSIEKARLEWQKRYHGTGNLKPKSNYGPFAGARKFGPNSWLVVP